MKKNLMDMQRHIEALRGSLSQEEEKNGMLKEHIMIIEHQKKMCHEVRRETSSELFETKKKAFGFKIGMFAALIVAVCSLVLNAILYDANGQFDKSLKLAQMKAKESENVVGQLIDLSLKQSEEIQRIKKANGVMIKNGCDKNVIKAIKATPLPELANGKA